MAKDHLHVVDGVKLPEEGDAMPLNERESNMDALPHPLPEVLPPPGLKSRVLSAVRALDAELKNPQLVLEPLIPPASLKRRIFERLSTLEGAARDVPTSVQARGQTKKVIRRMKARNVQRRHRGGRMRQTVSTTRRMQVLVVGLVAVLSVLVTASAVALMNIRNAQYESERQALEARHAEMLALEAAREANRRLAELQAKELERREAVVKAERAIEELAAAHAQLQRTNEALSEALAQARHVQQLAKIARQNADLNAERALLAQMMALRSAEALRRERERDEERIALLEAHLGGLIMDLK